MPSETTRSLQRALDSRTLVFDGGMGTQIHACTDCTNADYLGRDNCTDILVKSRPDIIQRIHESYFAAGADIVETDTFGANILVGREFDEELASWTFELNRKAAEVARAAGAKYETADRPRFAVGSMGPGTKLVSLGQVTWDEMHASYFEQARGLIAGGIDGFMIETSQDLLQQKVAINAVIDALREARLSPQDRPIFASVTIETTGTMLLGSDIAAVVNALRPFPIASLGLNCATGPVEMAEHVAYLSKHWDRAISVLPNAGLPILVDGQTEYPMRAKGFRDAMRRFVEEYKVNAIGGCCGTTPEHIRELCGLVEELGLRNRRATRTSVPQAAGCSSLYGFVEFKQENSFLVVAERTNANGSRRFKRLLDENDYDGLVSMAREEVKDGGQLLDVCVDFVGRHGVSDMTEVASRYVRQVDAPLMLDSTDAKVLEAGLKRHGGKAVVNSINLEDGEIRMDHVCPMLARYGAACVALTIDEDPQAGMAKTAARKLEIAARIHRLYTEKWNLPEEDLLFDPLTFTIATGNDDDRRLGLETLDGIALIAQHFPKCGIVLGLSNISFGLKASARAVLNSVYLHHARERGLTAAIVHASKILPRNRIAEQEWTQAEWLIFDRRGADRPEGQPENFDPLLSFIGLFPDGMEDATPKANLADLPVEERLQRHIIDGEMKNLDATLAEAMQTYAPLIIINDHLLAGMKVVGELFGSGQMQLPFVLQSAAVMKKAVTMLEPHMTKAEGELSRAKIVIATVAGDVHDIGKNLVDIILSNNGYEVSNIGIKQPLHAILDAWRKSGADAIGMSGLLVKSVGVMEENLHEMNRLGITVPVILGGAALTRHYAESHLRKIYRGKLYYGRDAFEGLAVCDALASNSLQAIDDAIDERLAKREMVDQKVKASRAAVVVEALPARSSVEVLSDIPIAPFLGDRIVEEIPLTEIYPYVNKTALFRGQWGLKKGAMSDAEYEQHLAQHAHPVFDRLMRSCREERILRPQVVYGYFPAAADGDDLVVFDPSDAARELERFHFPRQGNRDRLCISDFFRPITSSARDVVGFSCVTMGLEASHRAKQLFERNEYTEYLYLHGFGVECAEALAELWHKRMRAELGIGHEDSTEIRHLFSQQYRGSRYSFGYPACPDMSDQEKLFRLLKPERIGCVLTENWQIVPEQSTSAIIVHHPAASYFAVEKTARVQS
ncbi:MAG: methionine synthase [Phycisphaerales bacterium]|nr:methionine synthase [Phycisphaerales bacterium]